MMVSMRNVARVAMMATALSACMGDNTEVDRPPVVAGQHASTEEDTAVSFALDATDPEGRPLEISVAPPSHGLVDRADRTFTYTPEPDYHGADAFEVLPIAERRAA